MRATTWLQLNYNNLIDFIDALSGKIKSDNTLGRQDY